MPFTSAFGTQVAAIMDVLTKAAVAEITKLAEEGSVVLRMEVRRRDSEIQELRRSLKMKEAELREAQEAASRVKEEKREHEAAGRRQLQLEDIKEDHEADAAFPASEPADSLHEPQNGMYENQNFSPVIKQEADGELPVNTATDGAQTDVRFPAGGQDASVWPATIEESSVATQPHMQISPLRVEQYSACRDSETSFNFFADGTKKRTDCLSVPSNVEVPMHPICAGSNLPASAPGKQFRSESHSAVTLNEGAAFALLQPQRAPAGALGLNTENSFSIRNGLRPKKPSTVWRTSPKLFMCLVCNKNFPRLSQLEEHKSTHQTAKPFRCLQCGKSFTQKTRLKTHQSVHTGERPFSCKICGKMFSRQDNCLRHERFHSGLKPHVCRQCGKSFTVLANLRIHQEIHLQER
uniref:C2H2-type domain-containing protein n=1 Tax=Oryzias latipes TaxID=8090 RepID=A0A3P9J7C1_ORYLA